MTEIFISYSHTDSRYAHKLEEAFNKRGFDVFIDDRIDYGTQWPHVLQERLDSCAVLVLIMSTQAFKSDWVQNELSRAKRKKKKVFPLLLEGEPWLSVEATQYTDVSDGQLPPARFFDLVKNAFSPGQVQPYLMEPIAFHHGVPVYKLYPEVGSYDFEDMIAAIVLETDEELVWDNVQKEISLSMHDLQAWFYQFLKARKENAVVGVILAIISKKKTREMMIFQAVFDEEGSLVVDKQIIVIDAAIDPEKEFKHSGYFDRDETYKYLKFYYGSDFY